MGGNGEKSEKVGLRCWVLAGATLCMLSLVCWLRTWYASQIWLVFGYVLAFVLNIDLVCSNLGRCVDHGLLPMAYTDSLPLQVGNGRALVVGWFDTAFQSMLLQLMGISISVRELDREQSQQQSVVFLLWSYDLSIPPSLLVNNRIPRHCSHPVPTWPLVSAMPHWFPSMG